MRALAGAVYVLLIVGSLLLGNVSFGLLCLIIMIFSMDEYFRLIKRLKIKVNLLPAVSMAVIFFLILMLVQNSLLELSALSVVLLFFILLMIGLLFKSQRQPITLVAVSSFSLIYIMMPMTTLYLMGFYNNYAWSNDFSYGLVLGFFILNWTSDTGAYLVGSLIGKTKLLERISPKKTIEGSIGAIVFTAGMSYLLYGFFGQVSALDWIIMGLLVVLFGTAGDLFQSLLKRKAEVKDSGKLIPGHGGVMDRFDSIYFSAPMIFVYLSIISQ